VAAQRGESRNNVGICHGILFPMLGVPLGTVKTLVFRGKRMLKERIVAALAARTGAP